MLDLIGDEMSAGANVITVAEAKILVRCMAGAYDVRYLRAEEKELYNRLVELAYSGERSNDHA